MVAAVEPNSGRAISAAAARARPSTPLAAPSCIRRTICSSMTTASSTTSPHRGRHAAQGHHVEAHAERQEHQAGAGQHGGQHHARDHHQPGRAQEDEQHQPGEQRAQQDGVAHRIGRPRHQLRLVVKGG